VISREEMVWSAIASLGRSGVGAIVPVDRAGAEAAGVMPQWLGLCGSCKLMRLLGVDESDGLFADRSMGGGGDSRTGRLHQRFHHHD
jgi:hypothetical protein